MYFPDRAYAPYTHHVYLRHWQLLYQKTFDLCPWRLC